MWLKLDLLLFKAKKRRDVRDMENSHREPGKGPLEKRISAPPRLIFTIRNIVAARLCLHRRL